MKSKKKNLLIFTEKEVKKPMNNLMSSKEIRNKMIEKLEGNMIRIVA